MVSSLNSNPSHIDGITFLDSQLPEARNAQDGGGGNISHESTVIFCRVVIVHYRHKRRDESLVQPFPVVVYFVNLEKERMYELLSAVLLIESFVSF